MSTVDKIFTLTIGNIDITFDNDKFNIEKQLNALCNSHCLTLKNYYFSNKINMYDCSNERGRCILKIIDSRQHVRSDRLDPYGNIRIWIDIDFIKDNNIPISVDGHLIDIEYLGIILMTFNNTKQCSLYKTDEVEVSFESTDLLFIRWDEHAYVNENIYSINDFNCLYSICELPGKER